MSYGRALSANDVITVDELDEALARLDVQLAAMNAAWDSTIGTTVPPQFVIDVGKTMLDNVVTPFTDLRLAAARDPVNFTITDLIREAGSTGDVMWQDRVLPVLLEAIAAKRNKAASMTIPSDFKQRIQATITFYQRGYVQLRDALREKSWLLKLGAVSELAVEWLITTSDALNELKKWLNSGGKAVYNTVVKAVELTELLLKVTLVGGLAFVAYQLFGKSSPKKNPARRRRRPRRR
jgi:hypothetical protein